MTYTFDCNILRISYLLTVTYIIGNSSENHSMILLYYWWLVTMGVCRNLSICSNAQIIASKFSIWNEFGGNLEWPLLISSRNCFFFQILPNRLFLANKYLFWQNQDEKYGAIIFHGSIFLKKYGPLQDSILRSRLPITPIKNEWLSRVHIWIFGKIRVEKRCR